MLERKRIDEIVMRISRRQIDPNTLTDHTRLIEDLLFDSIEIVQLVVELEKTFNIVFDPAALMEGALDDLSSVLRYVSKNVGGKQC